MDILRTKAHDKIDIGKDSRHPNFVHTINLEGVLLEPDDEISDLSDKQPDTKQISIISPNVLPLEQRSFFVGLKSTIDNDKWFTSFYFTALASSLYIVPDEVKIEVKNKVIKAFPFIKPFSANRIVDALSLIWNVEEVDSSSSQNDPCAKPSFFKINLPGTITKQPFQEVDLCLPPHKSESGMNYNSFYDDPQFNETVSLGRKKLTSHNITVLAGVSGSGRTSTAFRISIQNWSIYVDFSLSGRQYGDFMSKELESIRARPPEYGEHQTREQIEVFGMLDLAIISRELLLIKMLVQERISTPKERLFAMNIMNIEKIKDTLRDVDYISSLFGYIIECLRVESLILIFDEAQVLCGPGYEEHNGNSSSNKKRSLLQAYIEHLTHFPVTCLIACTYMHMASGISLVPSIGKGQGLHVHIVLKLPFLSHDDVLRNLEAVIDLTDVTPKTRDYLGYVLKGRPRNCASFARMLISERKSTNRTKDQEIRELLHSWIARMSDDIAVYLENACKYVGANLHPEKVIMDVLRLRVFYNHQPCHKTTPTQYHSLRVTRMHHS